MENKKEIERKWLVKILPNLTYIPPVEYERYFLTIDTQSETRIQKVNDEYEFESKATDSQLVAVKTKRKISKKEYLDLKTKAIKSLLRTSYLMSEDPEISVKIYHGDYEGLIRVEVEFESEKEAQNFVAPKWFGKEITETELGRDSKLVQLNRSQFLDIFVQFL